MFKKEIEIYPILINEFKTRGYTAKRVEQKGYPDLLVTKDSSGVFFWVEVKMYRGVKPLNQVKLTDIQWQPGQLSFRAIVQMEGKSKYKIYLYNKSGDRHVM